MGNCKNCGQPKNAFMANKFVCLQCDELLFDMEIEVDAPNAKPRAPRPTTGPVVEKPAVQPKAKLLRLVDKTKQKESDDSQEQETPDEVANHKSKKAA